MAVEISVAGIFKLTKVKAWSETVIGVILVNACNAVFAALVN